MSISISRFILNLREFYLSGSSGQSGSLQHLSSIKFASIVGNLGAPLGGERDNWEDEEQIEDGGIIVSDDPFTTGFMNPH